MLVGAVLGLARGAAAEGETETSAPELAAFREQRLPLAAWTLGIGLATLVFVFRSRRGKPPVIRRLAALDAVDEAIGRATEMGRPVLFVPGIMDMNDIQTVAGVTLLGRVARTAAEYDAQVEVPTSRSLVMEAARDAVQSACLAAGRPEAYQPDRVHYVTDEQFAYVAHVTGSMVRERPAACFLMGTFYGESLILAETGNHVGAIQIAGTGETSQLPFFVAACDYTLIGEEFFVASAYLSGEPDQLGSVQAQDAAKIAVIAFVVIGTLVATAAVIWADAAWLRETSDFLRSAVGARP